MSKQSNNIKVSVADIIQLFQTAPEQAYEQLISSSDYFHRQPKIFWDAFMQLDLDKLCKQFPDSVETFNQVVWLKLFFDLNGVYEIDRAKNIEAIKALNPDETSLIKSLFLCLELGESSVQPTTFPNYSEESLEAVKILLRDILPQLRIENKTSYSEELTQRSIDLIKVQVDIALLEEFLDAFVWADFKMMKKEESKGFVLSLPDDKPKAENLFVLNHLKTSIKRDFKRKESHSQISEEEHFKKVDPTLKTDKGLATVFIAGATVVSQTDGTTFMELNESFFQDFMSDDPIKKEAATFKMLFAQQEQNFHYQYRQALSRIYQPNDEIDIHALHLEIKNSVFVTLYDLLCVMSCLIARADVFRYIADFPNGSIKAVKFHALQSLKQQFPELTTEELHNLVNSYFVQSLLEIENQKDINTFVFVEHKTILIWLKEIEELKLKSEAELNAMIELIISIESPLPFNPLYKIDSKYYFSYTTCGKFNLNQLLYDNYISDKLFNSRFKLPHQQKEITSRSISRADSFANSTRDLLKRLTPYAESNIYYGGKKNNWEFGELEGDIDAIAYFEKENIILAIQIKLSNAFQQNEKRKYDWTNTRVVQEGVRQVAKDNILLQSRKGLKFISDKLNFKSEIKAPRLYPLIVTDNFFADHISFPFNESDDSVICLSYFELKHLLLNQKVHDKQSDWLPFEKDNPVTALIEAIETNSFWKFLNEFADNFKFSKTLSAITDDWKIEMKV